MADLPGVEMTLQFEIKITKEDGTTLERFSGDIQKGFIRDYHGLSYLLEEGVWLTGWALTPHLGEYPRVKKLAQEEE